MATTATISSSTTLPVVGRSTMSLVGASSPPTTPPATPTSPIMSNSSLDSASSKVSGADVVEAAAAILSSREMATTPPPSPPPASVSASAALLLPVTPFPLASLSEATLMTTDATTAAAGSAGTSLVQAAPSTTLPLSGMGMATTFFDDMINAPQPPSNILTLSPTTSIPDLYHDFFDNHPELYDSDQSSDPEMDLDPEDYSPAGAVIRARTMADLRHQTAAATTAIQAPLIADRPKLETVDTINLMLLHQTDRRPGMAMQGPHHHHQHGATSLQAGQVLPSDDQFATTTGSQRRKKA
ncbi:hypothetical protein BGZ98_008352, partial [Dissophora globulifera]